MPMSYFHSLSPAGRAIFWAVSSGILFALLNTLMRAMTLQMDPFQTQFLRYLAGLLVMLPLVLRAGWSAYRPKGMGGQLWRGAVHTGGLLFWFAALPHLPIADTTAIGFTTPIFIMIGAALVLREPVVPARWIAALLGFAGVLIVVYPKLAVTGGVWSLAMLVSSPLFAASFLITKALTRRDTPGVIVVWQSITVSMFTLPFALPGWQWPTPAQWLLFGLCGVLGSTGHWCLTNAYRLADISATQGVRFLDLIWATLLGLLVFGDSPSASTLVGGVVILVATLWIARREAGAARPAARPGD
ncbi:MAG: DMT family transporter [Burkholderiales bacterium]|jgi:drug/metabolite transporter (DMT)-like permease